MRRPSGCAGARFHPERGAANELAARFYARARSGAIAHAISERPVLLSPLARSGKVRQLEHSIRSCATRGEPGPTRRRALRSSNWISPPS